MAVKMSGTTHTQVFFEKVLAAHPLAHAKVKAMQAVGVSFHVSMYAVDAKSGGLEASLNLPMSTTSLQKDPHSYQSQTSLQMLLTWLDTISAQWLDASESVLDPPKWNKTSLVFPDQGPPSWNANPTVNINIPVPLKDAKFLGQRVLGTDSDSIYRVIAFMANGAKVAMKWNPKTGEVSFRLEAEKNLTNEVHQLILANGFHSKGVHYSLHLAIDKIPIQRVVGAVLLGFNLPMDLHVSDVGSMYESGNPWTSADINSATFGVKVTT